MYQQGVTQVVQAYAVAVAPLPNAEEPVNEAGLRNFLQANAWPNGLQESLVKGARKIPIRYFICDDSGSMAHTDGKKIVKSADGAKDRYLIRYLLSKLITAKTHKLYLSQHGSLLPLV